MAPSPARILSHQQVTALVARDTIVPIAYRVRALFSHDRRVSIARRYLDSEAHTQVAAGFTVTDVRVREADDGGSVGVDLDAVYRREAFALRAGLGDPTTEAAAWADYHDGKRAGLTRVDCSGGIPGDGPGARDQLVIRRWNECGVGSELVVAFDYASDIRRDVENLTFALGEVQEFVDRYPTLPEELAVKARTLPREQIDVEMMVVERVRDILRRHQAVTGRG